MKRISHLLVAPAFFLLVACSEERGAETPIPAPVEGVASASRDQSDPAEDSDHPDLPWKNPSGPIEFEGAPEKLDSADSKEEKQVAVEKDWSDWKKSSPEQLQEWLDEVDEYEDGLREKGISEDDPLFEGAAEKRRSIEEALAVQSEKAP